jgi:hypothetical protein
MTEEARDSAVGWWEQGYLSCKEELRLLLAKVDEGKKLGVILAFLHEGESE